VYLVISGEFEQRRKEVNLYKKEMRDNLNFDLMEFIPHTGNKAYAGNVKSKRFLRTISDSNHKRVTQLTKV
jgi:hypothetical protein